MKLTLQRSIEINKPVSHVFSIVADLNQWNRWSPWFHSEPTSKTVVAGHAGEAGQTQTWEGEVMGSGKLTLTTVEKNKIVMKIQFFKPWESSAEATFDLTSAGSDKTKVTWTIHSQLPIFMVFFKKMMAAYMGSDFERGLHMLKELAETGSVVSKQTYQGEKDFSGFQIVAKKTQCTISEVPQKMHEDFSNIDRLMKAGELTPPDSMISLYDKYDIPKGVCQYRGALVYSPGKQVKVPAGFELSTFANHRGLVVDYYGPYRNLGNPWSMIIGNQRMKKKKILKKVPMYEIYKTMPDGRPEKDIHTQIVLPIK